MSAAPTEDELADAGALGRSGNADTLARVLLRIAHADDHDRGLTTRAEQLLTTAGPRLWLALDVAVRRAWRYEPESSPVVSSGLRGGDLTTPQLVVLACHPNGYVREAVVARLGDRVPPLLALRAADWVEQVRERAQRSCERLLAAAPAEAFAALAPVAHAVRERRTGRWLADVLDAHLLDGPPEVLDTALTVTDWRTRRHAYLKAMAAGRLPLPRLLHAARTDPDLPIRIRCAQAAIRTARQTGDLDVPRHLLASRTASVRAEALHALGEPSTAAAALTDRSALVRATAQAVLRRTDHDPAQTYRALLTAGNAANEPSGPPATTSSSPADETLAPQATTRKPASEQPVPQTTPGKAAHEPLAPQITTSRPTNEPPAPQTSPGTTAHEPSAPQTITSRPTNDPPAPQTSPGTTAHEPSASQATVTRSGSRPAVPPATPGQPVSEPPAPQVIAGLGETGHGADADLLLPWLGHPLPRGRAEAARALRRLGHVPVDLLLPLLNDPFALVTRQVSISLRPRAGTLGPRLLRDLLDVRQPRHTRFAAYRLLRDHDVWTRLEVDLELVDDPLLPLRSHARADLFSWLNWEAATTYAMPDATEKDRLDRLVRRATPALGPHRVRLLRFHLGI